MKKVIKRIFLGVFALVIFALGAGIIPSYYSLEVSDYEFENEKIQESVKLVQLSDIHNAEFGKENQRLLKKLKECEPDLIFITGDLINSDENEISPMLDLIKKLREIAPIYFSLGNHEIEYEKRTGIDLTEKLEKAGAKVLEEKFVDVTVKGQKFRIVRKTRRNQKTVSIRQLVSFFSDMVLNVPFQEKIKFVVVMCMGVHRFQSSIPIVEQLEI